MKLKVVQAPFSVFEEAVTKEKQKQTTPEIATRAMSADYYTLFQNLPNPDPVLRAKGANIKVYEELRYDSRVNAVVESRKAAVLSQQWEIVHEDKAQVDFYSEIFSNYHMHDIMAEILDSVLYGYKPMEILWSKQGSYVIPLDLVGKPVRWFTYDADNKLRFLTKTNQVYGEVVPDNKFIVARNQATYDNPYGYPVLSSCFWPVSYRRNGFKWWVIFIEKYGMPWITANAPTGAKAQEMADLATRLESMVADAVAVIPADYKTEFFESNKTASSAAYKEFIDQQNNEIALAVLGNNLTTEVTGGSYAAAQSHMAVRYDITEGDTRIVEEVFNQLIKLTHVINFGSGEPPVFNLFPEKGVDKTLSERDVNLSGQGVKFSKEYYKRSYNLQDEDFAEPVEVAPVAPVVVPTQEPVPAVA